MNFQTSRSENGFIEKIFSVGHSDDNNVVKGFNTVQICQELINDCVF
jgi:hypothetical protein